MSGKVVEADAGIHSLAISVAVSVPRACSLVSREEGSLMDSLVLSSFLSP
jgi:hypothetical protein